MFKMSELSELEYANLYLQAYNSVTHTLASSERMKTSDHIHRITRELMSQMLQKEPSE